MIKLNRFKNGAKRIVTFSYDDGKIYDRDLIEIINRYGIRSTFHLNSGNIDKPGYVTSREIPSLYAGHEIATHGRRHASMNLVSTQNIVYDVLEDRKALEDICGYPVRGCSYPNGYFCEEYGRVLETIGIEYCRTIASTGKFGIPTNFLTWDPTCRHRDGLTKAQSFVKAKYNATLFYMWGHSYEFNDASNWNLLEDICKELAGHDDYWYATNIEIVDYIKAQRNLKVTYDNSVVWNPSACEVWFSVDDETLSVKGGETLKLR